MGAGGSVPVPPVAHPPEECSQMRKEDGPHFVYTPQMVRKVTFPAKGFASEAQLPSETLCTVFRRVIKTHGSQNAFRVERPCPPLDSTTKKAPPPMRAEDLTCFTYQQYFDTARQLAAGMMALGFKRHDCVCVFGFNGPEWIMSAVGALFAGGCFTGIYPSDTAEQVQWKSSLSNSSFGFAEDEESAKKFLKTAEQQPYLRALVHWNTDFKRGAAPFKRKDGSEVLMLHWEELLARGASVEGLAAVDKRMDEVKPTDVADLIFTSGTTGNPKAVMISHDNIVFEAKSMLHEFKDNIRTDRPHRSLSYLPLSHVAGALGDIFAPLFFTEKAEPQSYFEITFARPYDLKVGSLVDRLKLTRPTVFMGVPRVWEKIEEKLIAAGASVKGLKRKVANVAKGKALAYNEERQLGHSGRVPVGLGLARSKILNKVKNLLGLDKCLLGYSGAAPLKLTTQRFFAALDISICELYGMSETTGLATLTAPDKMLWGSCGYAMVGCEVAIFKVDPDNINNKSRVPPAPSIFQPAEEFQGEVCFRGRNVMLGYLANPAFGKEHVDDIIKKNAQVIDNEGWLHSGDKGTMDVNNMFAITGRYKELIKGAGGENIAPVPIEDHILKCFRGLSNVIMVGDKRKFNIALVTLKAEGATGEVPGTNKLDKSVLDIAPGVETIEQASKDPVWIKAITDAITKTNKNGLVCPSNAAAVQKFSILPIDFSVQTEELTPTLKLKRAVVEKKNAKTIDAVYESEATYVPHVP
jgi:long-chain-fatty-acid--CoA ligase ACSBG